MNWIASWLLKVLGPRQSHFDSIKKHLADERLLNRELSEQVAHVWGERMRWKKAYRELRRSMSASFERANGDLAFSADKKSALIHNKE